MKKPLLNEIERQIMHEDKSLYASRMKLRIAINKFEKAFMETYVGQFIEKSVVSRKTLLRDQKFWQRTK